MIAQQIINGIAMGSIYSLIALGLTMVYGVLRVLHIAHAAVYALGAYAGLLVYGRSGSILLASLAALAICSVFGLVIERGLYRPMLGSPPMVPLIASIGLFILMEDMFRVIAGPYELPFPWELQVSSANLLGVIVTARQGLILVVTLVALVVVWVMVNRTKIGLGWKATAQDVEMARAMGVNTNWIVAVNFAMGSALAAIAGILVGIYYNSVYPTMGSVPAYKALAIIVLGGLGSPAGTVVAAMFIGLVETMLVGITGFFLPRDAIAFVALIIMLMVRPRGILGRA